MLTLSVIAFVLKILRFLTCNNGFIFPSKCLVASIVVSYLTILFD